MPGCASLDRDCQLEWRHISQVRLEETHDLMELNFLFTSKDCLELAVKVDIATVISVLKPVLLNVLPQRSYDTSSCLLSYA